MQDISLTTKSIENSVQTPPNNPTVDAGLYYRLREQIFVNFSPQEDSPLSSPRKTEKPRRVIRHIRPETSPNVEVPFYILLIDIVRNLWFRARRFFRDFWY